MKLTTTPDAARAAAQHLHGYGWRTYASSIEDVRAGMLAIIHVASDTSGDVGIVIARLTRIRDIAVDALGPKDAT